MNKPTILFFARGYQADFFPALASDRYKSLFVTLTEQESRLVRARGGTVAACFEEAFAAIEPADVPDGYLATSLMADRFLCRFDLPQRLRILGKEIAFWRDLFDRYKPAAVVNELVAIEISEVLLIEARARGIRYLAGMNCVVEDLTYWLPQPLTLSGACLPARAPSGHATAVAAAYVEQILNPEYRPFYVKNLSNRRAPRPLLIGIAKLLREHLRYMSGKLSGRFRYEDYREEYAKRINVFSKSFFANYDSIGKIPAQAEVIFYPLHQEPEATLNYMSAFYSNQVSTIENILKCMNPDQVLVVKEHPVDKGALLRKKFADIRKNCSALYYFPAEVSGREILKRAERVVTLTSTVGWEAAALGKPVYVLGEIFYDSLGGLQRLHGFDDLRQRLRRPVDPAHLVDRDAIVRFVAQMVDFSWPGNPFPHDRLYDRENIDRVVDAIAAELP